MLQSNKCPHCGQPLEPSPYYRQATSEYISQRVAFGDTLANVDFRLAEYWQPARAAGIASDVVVPLLQALVSMIVAGVLAFWLSNVASWPVIVPLGAMAVSFASVWWWLLKDHHKSLWHIERIEAGEPQPQPQPASTAVPLHVSLEVREDETTTRYAHLPVDVSILRTMARAIYNGRSFAVSTWTGKGKPLSRSQFETLRDWLLANDYAYWVSPENRAQGIEFTAKGKAFWRALKSN